MEVRPPKRSLVDMFGTGVEREERGELNIRTPAQEVQQYLAARVTPEEGSSFIGYWYWEENRKKYPRLASLAFKLSVIQVS